VAPSPVSHLSAVPHAPGPAGGAVVVVSGVVVVVFVSGVVVSVVVSFAAFAAFAFAASASFAAVYAASSGYTTNFLFSVVGFASSPFKTGTASGFVGSAVHVNAAFALVTYTQVLGSSFKSLADSLVLLHLTATFSGTAW